MAIARMYAHLPHHALAKRVDWLTDNVRVTLHTSSYVPSQNNHQWRSAVTNEVPASGGYTTGGIALTSKTRTTSGLVTVLSAANINWPASTISARYAVLWVDTGDPATSPVLGYVDFESTQASNNGNFTLAWNAAGLFEIGVNS